MTDPFKIMFEKKISFNYLRKHIFIVKYFLIPLE